MFSLEQFFLVSLIVQILHSVEELSTGFHKKWYLFTMPFWVFFAFEMIFSAFWIGVLLLGPTSFQAFFLALMFANGVQHLIWAGSVKRYVPGLVTAPLHIAVFLVFYFSYFNS